MLDPNGLAAQAGINILCGFACTLAESVAPTAYTSASERLVAWRGLPRNHDFERGVRRARAFALVRIVEDYSQSPAARLSPRSRPLAGALDETFTEAARLWVRGLLRKANAAGSTEAGSGVDQLAKAVNAILAQHRTGDADGLQFRRVVEDATLWELRSGVAAIPIPAGFESHFRSGIDEAHPAFIEMFGAFLAKEVKENPAFRRVLDAVNLASLSIGVTSVSELVRTQFDLVVQRLEDVQVTVHVIQKDVRELHERLEGELKRIGGATAPASVEAPAKKRGQFEGGALSPYVSQFVKQEELPEIHAINDSTFEASVLLPRAQLEAWWRANPYSMRRVRDHLGRSVGYWNLVPLTAESFRGLAAGRLAERDVTAEHVLAYDAIPAGACLLYIGAVVASGRMASAAVLLDLVAFLCLLNDAVRIDGMCAQSVQDDPIPTLTSFRWRKVAERQGTATWLLETAAELQNAFTEARHHLRSLPGLVPQPLHVEEQALRRLLGSPRRAFL